MTDAKQDFQALDSTVVQVRSVLNFMYTLGYTLDETSKTGRFITKAQGLQGNRFLSFESAVKMHNLGPEKWGVDPETGIAFPSTTRMQSGFTVLGVRLAIATKLVQQAKLSIDRAGRLITKDIMVKPLNPAVLQLVEPA